MSFNNSLLLLLFLYLIMVYLEWSAFITQILITRNEIGRFRIIGTVH